MASSSRLNASGDNRVHASELDFCVPYPILNAVGFPEIGICSYISRFCR